MAASTTTGVPVTAFMASSPSILRSQRRRISPLAGRALEILGHSIEYLADEFVNSGGSLSPSDGRLEAVQLLMAFNRQIYYECPEVPTLAERCQAFLGCRPS